MARKPTRVCVIGFDYDQLHLDDPGVPEHFPTVQKMIDGGTVTENCLAPFPHIFPVHWITLATGTTPGTHAIINPLDQGTANTNGNSIRSEFLGTTVDAVGKCCITLNFPGFSRLQNGVIVDDTEHAEDAGWLGDTAVKLIRESNCDIFWMHCPRMTPAHDQMLARIVEASGKDTLFVLVLDPMVKADMHHFNPYEILVSAGFTVMTNTGSEPDLNQSKAILKGACHVFINLKDRNSHGIVESKDYEQVQYEIINALLTYIEPRTGRRPVAVALTKNDARLLGLKGENIGDVIYALSPEFGKLSEQILPTASIDTDTCKTFLVFNGPGIKKGARLTRTVGLQDVVPTICYLADLPIPAQAEGAILYQALKDPDAKSKELNKMRDGLDRMGVAIHRKSRQPWDKHDCA